MSKRPRPSYNVLVDESGSEGGQIGHGDSAYDPNPTPKKRANVQSSIRTSQKVKLAELDTGSCLVTRETDGKCIEVCHVLQRKENEDNLELYEKCFGMTTELNVDSVKNLIHLRADWHRSFNAGCWALVPTMKELDDIIKRLKSKKKWKYTDLDVEEYDYQFIRFPSLGQKPIFRLKGDEKEYERIANDEMPILQSHIHPYFVIVNALPKFQQATLTAEQAQLLTKLVQIDTLWQPTMLEQISSGSGTSHGRGGHDRDRGGRGGRGKRGSGGRGGGGKRGGGSKDNRGGRAGGMGDKAGNKISHEGGKARGHNGDGKEGLAGREDGLQAHNGDAEDKSLRKSRKDLNRIQGGLPTPVSTSSKDSDGRVSDFSDGEFPDDQQKVVLDWREQVMKAGPLAPDHQKVVWSVREQARQPYRGDWGNWRTKWDSSPPDRSKFTSNDWAVYWKMFSLPWHPPELQ